MALSMRRHLTQNVTHEVRTLANAVRPTNLPTEKRAVIKTMNSKFFSLTEELNSLDYFDKAVSFIRETQYSDIEWKWVVLSLHGALYGFAVSACQGTNAHSVLDNKRRNHLISFNEAIKRCEAGRAGKALVLSSEERKSVRVLKKVLRDEFEHFKPCNHTFRLNGIAEVALNCIHVTETLATATSPWVKLDKHQRQRVKELGAEARTILLKC